MIVKPAVSFLTQDSDPEFSKKVGVVITSTTGNPYFVAQQPIVLTVKSGWDSFNQAALDAAGGGTALTAKKDELRLGLAEHVRDLASAVQTAVKGSMEKLLTSGFPVQKSQRQKIGTLPAPENLILTQGQRGELIAKAGPVYGVGIYNWEMMSSTMPGVWVSVGQSTAAKTLLTGLTAGVTYTVRVNASGTAGPSDWSNPVALMAI